MVNSKLTYWEDVVKNTALQRAGVGMTFGVRKVNVEKDVMIYLGKKGTDVNHLEHRLSPVMRRVVTCT